MNIKGKFVTLRAIEKTDLELMREMLNDPEIENLVVGWAFPISKYQQEKWYENNIGNQTNLRFIVETDDGQAVGLATLVNIDWKNRRAKHGIKIAKLEDRNKGYGKDTVMAIMRYAFDELQLNRLDTTWLEYNITSRTMYKKCGWKEEGKLREAIYKNGSYKDLLLGGILKSDYEELIKKNNYWEE